MKVILLFFLLMISSLVLPQKNVGDFTYKNLINNLDKIATQYLEPSAILKQEFLQLQKTHHINGSQESYRDFVRARLAFELTRDSGLWQIRWAVTDKEPNSDSIWAQWNTINRPQYEDEKIAQATAVAECDELSALFAFIAKSLGVEKVGLFWPTWNHTVGVWVAKDNFGNPVRVVVPTSQVFLDQNATFGTKQFDPYKQKVIYPYNRKDISLDHQIPKSMFTMMLNQARKYGSESSQVLQKRRNRLSEKFGGS